jgi:DNA-binding MarR family transcriptional regulator
MIDVYASKKDSTSSLCACTTVKKISRVLGRAYDSALASAEINVTQYAVLRCIARHSGEPLARVAEELEMDRTSLYRAIAPMAREGWIKIAAGADGRSRSAKVTGKGGKILDDAGGEWEKVQEQLLGAFGKSEWRALASELHRLGECVRKAR